MQDPKYCVNILKKDNILYINLMDLYYYIDGEESNQSNENVKKFSAGIKRQLLQLIKNNQ